MGRLKKIWIGLGVFFDYRCPKCYSNNIELTITDFADIRLCIECSHRWWSYW